MDTQASPSRPSAWSRFRARVAMAPHREPWGAHLSRGLAALLGHGALGRPRTRRSRPLLRENWARARVARGSASARLRGGPALRHRAGTQKPSWPRGPCPQGPELQRPSCAGTCAPQKQQQRVSAAQPPESRTREQNTGPAQGGPRLAAAAPSPATAGRHAGAFCDLEPSSGILLTPAVHTRLGCGRFSS